MELSSRRRDQSDGNRSATLIKRNGLLPNKIISRSSSVGCSSRIYYRSSEGVPFTWEMQPGTPKEPPKEDILPPLSPPPAILSQGFPKPNINVNEEPPSMSHFYKLSFLKRSLKLDCYGIKEKLMTRGRGLISNKPKNLEAKHLPHRDHDQEKDDGRRTSNFEVCCSDVEFMASPRNSSCSSTSSRSSSYCSNGGNYSGRPSPSPARNNSLCKSNYYGRCNPWNFSSLIVRVVRRP